MSKTISLNLSTKAILQNIYASSALYCLNNGDSDTLPPILTRDHQPALLRLIKDAFAFVTLRFIAHVEACNLNDETATGNATDPTDDMILTIDLRAGDDTPNGVAAALRVSLEHAIAAYALHIAFINHDDTASSTHLSTANNHTRQITHLLASPYSPTHITPRY